MPAITYERIAEYQKTALQVLEDNGGSLRSRDVRAQVKEKLTVLRLGALYRVLDETNLNQLTSAPR
jgi:hypothetical protein